MMVPKRSEQYRVMLEAVQNHTPDAIVIDEISTAEEVRAVKSIRERGVALVSAGGGGFPRSTTSVVLTRAAPHLVHLVANR